MIKLQNLLPDVYYKQSRDFQFIGRLYDIVLNSVKTNADLLYEMPINDNSPDIYADLMALTLGFKPKHNYTAYQLKTLCRVFPLALKNKGSIKSLVQIANALAQADGSTQQIKYSIEDNYKITLFIPMEVKDLTILYDLLDYILPAGMTCDIVKQVIITTDTETKVQTKDSLIVYTKSAPGETPITPISDNELAVIPKIEPDSHFENSLAKSTIGIIANSNLYKVDDDEDKK